MSPPRAGCRDTGTVRAFLEERHLDLAGRIDEFARSSLASLPEPADDGAARAQARDVLGLLGGRGWFQPILEQDLRALCLIREVVAWASPLADAVYALQALGSTPIVLAGPADLRERWLPAMARGEAMAAFAMTEPEAGSDVASITTAARRDGIIRVGS